MHKIRHMPAAARCAVPSAPGSRCVVVGDAGTILSSPTGSLWTLASGTIPSTGLRAVAVNRRPGLPRGMTMAALTAEHAQALREAFDEPVDLLGASTGGSIAQQLAAEHRDVVRRLALVSTGCRLGPNAKLVQRQIAARVRAGATRHAVAVMAGALAPPALRLPAACLGWLLPPRLFSESGLQDMATTIEAEHEFDLALLPTVRAPTLLVVGGRDRFYDEKLFEQTARLIPGCVLEMHPKRGHITVLSDPRAVAQIRGFLNHDKN